MARGSKYRVFLWLVARGSEYIGSSCGSWLVAQNIGASCGSWLEAQNIGSLLVARGSWLKVNNDILVHTQ